MKEFIYYCVYILVVVVGIEIRKGNLVLQLQGDHYGLTLFFSTQSFCGFFASAKNFMSEQVVTLQKIALEKLYTVTP